MLNQDIIRYKKNKRFNNLCKLLDKIPQKEILFKNNSLDEIIFGNCPICLEEIKKCEHIVITDCSHNYHKFCYHRWYQESKTCPLCRNNILARQEYKNGIKKIYSPYLNQNIKNIIMIMFIKIIKSYKKYCPIYRKSFLNSFYVLYKIFQILRLSSHVKKYKLIMNKNDLYFHDYTWRKICNDNKWDFYSSFNFKI